MLVSQITHLKNFRLVPIIIVFLFTVFISIYEFDRQVHSQQEGDMLMQISSDSEESVTSYVDALIKAPLLVSQSTIVGITFSQIMLSNILRTRVLLVNSDRSSNTIKIDRGIVKRLVSVLMVSVAALIVSASCLFILQIYNLSTELGIDFSDTFSILINTSIGTVWLLRIITSIMIIIFSMTYFIYMRRGLHSNKPFSKGVSKLGYIFLGAILISGSINLISNSLVSHNAATEFLPLLAISVDWFHVMGVSIWLGGLFYLSLILLYVIRISSKEIKETDDDSSIEIREEQIEVRSSYSLAVTLPYFSMIAIICLGVIGITGLYMAWLQLQSVGSLFNSVYGNILILKLCVIVPMIILGAYHQIKLHCVMVHTASRGSELLEQSKILSNSKQGKESKISPNKSGDRYDPFIRFSKTVKIESLIGIAVLIISAFLTITSPPTMVQSDSQMQMPGSGSQLYDSITAEDGMVEIPKISDGFTVAAIILGVVVLVMSLYYYRKNKNELKSTISLLEK
jgi:copper transport protein